MAHRKGLLLQRPESGGSPAYSNAGLLYYTDNTGNSVYNGLTLQVTERFQKIFTLNANYTFSHTLDDGTFTTFVSTPQDLYDRSLERANSNQDVRHRFIANFSVEGPKDSFLRNFTFSNIVTLQSPRPFTLFVGFDANGDTNPVTDRVGLSGRNTYYGDDLYSWDLRVARYFQFRERYRLDLMVDAFNALNRPNVDEVTSVYGAAVFCGTGPIPQRYKDAGTIATQNEAIAFDAGTGPPTCPLMTLGPVPAPPVPNGGFGSPGPCSIRASSSSRPSSRSNRFRQRTGIFVGRSFSCGEHTAKSQWLQPLKYVRLRRYAQYATP